MAKQSESANGDGGERDPLGAPINAGSPLDVFNDAIRQSRSESGENQSAPDPESALPPDQKPPEDSQQQLFGDPPPEPTGQPTTPILDMYREKGVNVTGFNDDKSFVEYLETHATGGFEAQQELRNVQSQLSEFNEISEDPEFQEWKKQREDAKATPEPTEQPEELFSDWKPPEVNPDWEELVMRGDVTFDVDQQRFVAAKDWVDPKIADKLTEARRWESDRARQLVRDFPQLAREMAENIVQNQIGDFDERVAKAVSEALESRDKTVQVQSELDTFLVENRQDLYQLDEKGDYLYDASGLAKLTDGGTEFAHLIDEAKEFAQKHFGIDDPNQEYINEYAISRWRRPVVESASTNEGNEGESTSPPLSAAASAVPPSASQHEPSESPAQTTNRLKEEFAKEKQRIVDAPEPSRKVASAATRTARDLDFSEMLDEEAKKQGFT